MDWPEIKAENLRKIREVLVQEVRTGPVDIANQDCKTRPIEFTTKSLDCYSFTKAKQIVNPIQPFM